MINNKIVMVNSFKGGAGKTSTALSLCMTAAHNELKNSQKEIYYIDLDILGTSAKYAIFNKSKHKQLKYMSLTEGKISDNDVEFDYIAKKKSHFKACLIDPQNRLTSNHAANLSQRSNASCLNGIFTEKILSYIEGILRREKDSLIVLDCSPGLSEFERLILEKLYHKQIVDKICSLYEVYVTTLDIAHIKKTIESMETLCNSNPNLEERNIKIITNDLVNVFILCKETETNGKIDMNIYISGLTSYIKTEIEKLFNIKENKIVEGKISVFYNKYNETLIKSNILFNSVEMLNEGAVALEQDAEPYYNPKLYDEVIKGGSR